MHISPTDSDLMTTFEVRDMIKMLKERKKQEEIELERISNKGRTC